MKQQTAVQFLFSELERCQYFIGNDIYQAYKEALYMESKQIIDAYNEGGEKVQELIAKMAKEQMGMQ
jgi:hypothetical protein